MTIKNLSPGHSDLMAILRSLSAMTILFCHGLSIFFISRYGFHAAVKWLLIIMQYPLMILILQSGFFIPFTTSKQIIEQNHFSVRHFVYARLMRLYPPLIFALLLSAAVFLIFNHGNFTGNYTFFVGNSDYSLINQLSLSLKSFFSTLFFLQGIFIQPDAPRLNLPLWTLSYELWCYVVFALLTIMAINRRYKLSGLLLAILVMYMLYAHQLQFAAMLLTWFAGAILAKTYFSSRLNNQNSLPPTLFLIAILSIISLVIGLHDGMKIFLSYDKLPNLLFRTLLSFLIAALIALAMRKEFTITQPLLKRLASNASFSYTLYLIHYPLLLMAFRYTGTELQQLPVIFTVLAMCIYLIIICFIAKQAAKIVENRAFFTGRHSFFRIFKFFGYNSQTSNF